MSYCKYIFKKYDIFLFKKYFELIKLNIFNIMEVKQIAKSEIFISHYNLISYTKQLYASIYKHELQFTQSLCSKFNRYKLIVFITISSLLLYRSYVIFI